MRTTFPKEIEGSLDSRTDSAQILVESEPTKMKFPKVIRHRKAEVTLYGKKKNYPFYRIAYRADGKRLFVNFKKYGVALAAAQKKAKELAEGNPAAALTAAQARDALTAFQMLDAYRPQGQRLSLSMVVSEFIEVSKKTGNRTLREVADGFIKTVATVTRIDIGEAIKEFLKATDVLATANEGQRAQLSTKYAYNRRRQLEKFAEGFPGTAVCDLTKAHLDHFIQTLGKIKSKSRNQRKAISAKSRNHYRAVIRQFLSWAVRKDYLPQTHRLAEADGLRTEHSNNAETTFYSPAEFQALLNAAKDNLASLRPILAIGGLAGLRTAELLRMDWADIWRVPDHIEVTAGKSKTRQRRLVEVCSTLKRWLESYRDKKSGLLWEGHEVTFQQNIAELCLVAKVEKESVERKHNGLRHAFCTYHFALHANENLTAQQAGNSPAMIHQHYKGLATKAEAEKWFAVSPGETEVDTKENVNV
jgi:integrase